MVQVCYQKAKMPLKGPQRGPSMLAKYQFTKKNIVSYEDHSVVQVYQHVGCYYVKPIPKSQKHILL